MAFDEGLAERIRDQLGDRTDITEKRMFGGIAFMLDGNMMVGIVKDDLMARVGPDQEKAALARPGARPMDFTGKPMKGYVFVAAEGLEEDGDLGAWIEMAERFVQTLPPK